MLQIGFFAVAINTEIAPFTPLTPDTSCLWFAIGFTIHYSIVTTTIASINDIISLNGSVYRRSKCTCMSVSNFLVNTFRWHKSSLLTQIPSWSRLSSRQKLPVIWAFWLLHFETQAVSWEGSMHVAGQRLMQSAVIRVFLPKQPSDKLHGSSLHNWVCNFSPEHLPPPFLWW